MIAFHVWTCKVTNMLSLSFSNIQPTIVYTFNNWSTGIDELKFSKEVFYMLSNVISFANSLVARWVGTIKESWISSQMDYLTMNSKQMNQLYCNFHLTMICSYSDSKFEGEIHVNLEAHCEPWIGEVTLQRSRKATLRHLVTISNSRLFWLGHLSFSTCHHAKWF